MFTRLYRSTLVIMTPTWTSSLVKISPKNAKYHLLVKGPVFCFGLGFKKVEPVVLCYLSNMNLIHCTFELCPVYERSKTIFCPLALQPTVTPPKNKSTNVKKKGPGTGKRVKGSPTEDTLNRQISPEPPAGKQIFYLLLVASSFSFSLKRRLTLIQM